MSQQINLFNPLFLKQKKHFSAAAMLQALGLLVAGIAIFYGYAMYQRMSLQQEAAATERVYAASRDRFTKVSTELSPNRAEQQIEEELKAARDAVAVREALIDQLRSRVSDPSAGYSAFLRAFARQTTEGVWLTGIQIDGGDRRLTITGRTVQADLLPEYIRRLGAEGRFKGRSFEKIQAARHEAPAGKKAEGGFIDFTLVSPGDAATSFAALERKSDAKKAN